MTPIRRLAAILAADVAGYSRLIGADESGTLQAFKMIKAELFDPRIAAHNGRLVKTTGDGFLVEFSSVVDALLCAREAQAHMAELNATVPKDQRIEFRIGIHQGDIVVEEGDIFGDGVNVAARLEGLAPPGGICVSARVQEDLLGRLDVAFEDMGEQALKNIARPVRVFRLNPDRVAEAAAFSAPPTHNDQVKQLETRAVEAQLLAPGTLLGHTYIIEALLARNRVTAVYRARNAELRTEYAIKIILPSAARDPKFLRAFRDEARRLGQVNNDVIPKYEGFFQDERGLRYLVTEFVHGKSLENVLRHRRLEPDEVLRLRDRLALGLAAAHEMGIVHRAVSPENIVLPEGRIDRAKLINFSVAESADPTETIVLSDFAGRYSFLSPEQEGPFGGPVDLRSDIYSLGLVLAAAALGFARKLDMGKSAVTAIAARQHVPDLSDVPAPLRPVIAPMLEPRPEDRPPTMRALLSKEGEAGGAPRRGFAKDLISASKLRLAWWAALVGTALAASIGAALIVREAIPPPSIEEVRSQVAAATSEYRCASLDYSVALDRSLHLSGFAPTQGDIDRLRSAVDKISGIRKVVFDVKVRIWPYCEAVALLQPIMKRTPAPAPNLGLVPPSNGAHIDNALVIDVRAPSFDGYVYIDYFANGDGDVIHLYPNPWDPEPFIRPARSPLLLGKPPFKRCWTLGGSAGEQQLVTLIGATKPLFKDQRPEQENARDYLPILSDAINNLPQGSSTATTWLFFRLLEPLPFPYRQMQCRADG